MNLSILPYQVRELKTMLDNGSLVTNHPIQRNVEQWDLQKKSELVHSILANYPIPNLYFIKDTVYNTETNESETIFSVLDGKQRLSNIVDFIDNKYALSKTTPQVIVNKKLYILAGKKYDDLDSELKEEILRYKFNIYNIEFATDEEIETIFYRMNNGVSLSTSQKTKAKMGIDTAKRINSYLDTMFFKKICHFTPTQLKKADDLTTLLQTFIVVDDSWTDKTISNEETMIYSSNMKRSIQEDVFEKISNIIEYLESAFIPKTIENDIEWTPVFVKEKFMKKINIPIVFKTAELAMDNNIDPIRFKEWFTQFADKYNPSCEYASYCGTSSIKEEKVLGRLRVMQNDFREFFNINDNNTEENDNNETNENNEITNE